MREQRVRVLQIFYGLAHVTVGASKSEISRAGIDALVLRHKFLLQEISVFVLRPPTC